MPITQSATLFLINAGLAHYWPTPACTTVPSDLPISQVHAADQLTPTGYTDQVQAVESTDG